MLDSMKVMMELFMTQMTEQSRQVQETISAQQQADKEEILGKLSESPADDDE